MFFFFDRRRRKSCSTSSMGENEGIFHFFDKVRMKTCSTSSMWEEQGMFHFIDGGRKMLCSTSSRGGEISYAPLPRLGEKEVKLYFLYSGTRNLCSPSTLLIIAIADWLSVLGTTLYQDTIFRILRPIFRRSTGTWQL